MVGDDKNPNLLTVRDHPHLVLRAALPPRPRFRARRGGGRRVLHHPDQRRHADDLLAQVAVVRARHLSRTTVLGVEPENVLVIELHDPVSLEEVERSGLRVVEATDASAVIAFSGGGEMAEFVRRCEAYGSGPGEGAQGAPYEGLLDRIAQVRSMHVDDVLEPGLAGLDEALVRVDVVGWCPDDRVEAGRRHAELRGVIERAGAEVVDSALDVRAGLSVFRVDLPPPRLVEIADTQRVRSLRRCPRPILGQVEALTMAASELPEVDGPGSRAPLTAVVDSGVRSDHPLIRPALHRATSVGGLPTFDEAGHGTLVASLALYGSLEERLSARFRIRAAARLVSVRVLDEQALFPDADLWERDLDAAITAAADAGARIVVLSLGDVRRPYRPPGPVPVAAIVDRLARERGLVVVTTTGNTVPDHFPSTDGIEHSYPEWLLSREDNAMLPPAMAALALTVGGVVGGYRQGLRPHRDDVHERSMGAPGHPSAWTRCGPGVEHAVKPELCAPAGTATVLVSNGRVVDGVRASHVVGAAGGIESSRLLASASGTSFAAPLVGHAAARVLERYPALSANAVRALVLAGADDVPVVVQGDGPTHTVEQHRRLTGHGEVNGDRSVNSTDHRAMLLAEGDMPVDGVHFYTVPVPRAFFSSRHVVVRATIAHDPAVRATRLDYLANRMQVHVYRDLPLDDVQRKYDAVARDEHGAPDDLARWHLDLQPAAQASCHAANQCSTVTYRQRWKEALRGTDLVVVVQNTSRWPSDPNQRYALCLMLETDESAEPLYDELRVRFEALSEIEAELEN